MRRFGVAAQDVGHQGCMLKLMGNSSKHWIRKQEQKNEGKKASKFKTKREFQSRFLNIETWILSFIGLSSILVMGIVGAGALGVYNN